MLDPIRFIEDKRDGLEHAPGEIEDFVRVFHQGKIPDYQAAAWLMAAFLRGLSKQELEAFTVALANSGKTVLFPPGLSCVDKHSTGGVGDKTSLVLVPLVAACGAPVAKLSGRGLGFTGGTVDKLESIEGFRAHLSMKEFVNQVERIGCAISGHSEELAPAEKRFYELRDVTGTIPSVPLIASSIVSKKIAGGSRAFVFDVKTGSGAFMRSIDEARTLARQLVELSLSLGRRSLAVISGMDQPLGRWVGNAAEVREAVDVLKGSGPDDTRELCLALGGAMLFLSGAAPSKEAGRDRCAEALSSGAALERFKRLLESQGADPECLDFPEKNLPLAAERLLVRAKARGKIASFETNRIGTALRHLGGGRQRKEDQIDHAVAIEIMAKIGTEVSQGDPVFTVYHHGAMNIQIITELLEASFEIAPEAAAQKVVLEVLD